MVNTDNAAQVRPRRHFEHPYAHRRLDAVPDKRLVKDEGEKTGGCYTLYPLPNNRLIGEEFERPLLRDAEQLERDAPAETTVVLLGSIATNKYVAPLLRVFDEGLLFPREFIGRGDMSRGGLMLRHAQQGEELEYIPVANAVRHGKRPPKLSPLR